MAQFPQVQAARYVSQYDPAQEQMHMQIMKDRSNRFEQSYNDISEAQAKIGEIFFLDQENGQKVKDRFAAEKDEIMKRYNNDYEAAAPELTKLMVKERSNPIYNLNKYQQQKMAEANQRKAQLGPNASGSKEVAPDLIDPKTNKVYCSLCEKEIPNINHFMLVQLKTLKQ